MNTIDIYADNPKVTLEYMIAVMQASLSGKQIQFRLRHANPDGLGWNHTTSPYWQWTTMRYRVDPNSRPKKTVPMERDDYPPVCWFKHKTIEKGFYFMMTGMSDYGVTVSSNHAWTYQELSSQAEYSTDRKTWLPCTKEVSA